MASGGLARPMDESALHESYARYQSAVWDASLDWARGALGATDAAEVRRAAARRFVRTCLSYRAWSQREPPGASGASEALLGAAA